jgi:hypothetical protein
MKKAILYSLFASLSFILISTGCQREVDGTLPDNPQPPVEQTVNASVTGRVINDKKEPVSGALVNTANGGTAITDINGEFSLQNVLLNKNAGFIKVEKAGYFTGSRTFVVSTTSDNITQIQLIPKTVVGSFVASAGGNITIPNGGGLVFPSNGIVNTSNSAAYTGNVSVAAYFLNPQAGNFGDIMPGTLRGTRTDNSQVALQSFGMVAVELTGAAGEKLQLVNGKTASINLPIASTLLAFAPSSIPLWYFDEATGLWKEEGMATKQGSSYVGTVSHFSFWNCDAPFPLVDFSAAFKNQNGDPVVNAKVVITTSQGKTSIAASDITNSEGKVSGKIPADKNLLIEVYNFCGDLLYTKNFTTATSATNLGAITVTSSIATVSINGTVSGCNAAAVTNGFVYIAIGNITYAVSISNGSFSAGIKVCSAGSQSARIVGFDIANNKQSDTTVLTVNTTNATTVSINTCASTIQRFLNYTLNAVTYTIIPPADSLVYHAQGSSAMIQAYSYAGTPKKMNITCSPITGTGTVPVTDIYTTVTDGTYFGKNISSMNITEYTTDATGTYVAGNITGLVTKDTTSSVTTPLTLNFRLRK